MTLYIGENLKKQRKLRELTQEQLADILGVSFQSVSKWERNEGYPDIETLPTIANYFGITVDELMGMSRIKDTSEADNILKTVNENASKGHIEENIALLEEAVKRFPNDYRLLSEYAHYLTFVDWDREGEAFRRNSLKAVEVAERILAECTDSKIRREMQSLICYYYKDAGMFDKAKEAAMKLPGVWQSSEAILCHFLKGEERTEFLQNSVISQAALLYLTLQHLSDMDCENNSELTWEQRIKIQQKSIALLEIVFDDGDCNFYAHDFMCAYQRIALMAVLINDCELALESLEKAADYAIYNDNLPESKPYTSLLVNKLEYRFKDTRTNSKTTLSKGLLGLMACNRYDGIRNEPRFRAVEERLKNMG